MGPDSGVLAGGCPSSSTDTVSSFAVTRFDDSGLLS